MREPKLYFQLYPRTIVFTFFGLKNIWWGSPSYILWLCSRANLLWLKLHISKEKIFENIFCDCALVLTCLRHLVHVSKPERQRPIKFWRNATFPPRRIACLDSWCPDNNRFSRVSFHCFTLSIPGLDKKISLQLDQKIPLQLKQNIARMLST